MVNYPNRKNTQIISKIHQSKKTDTAHRGIPFEDDINTSNEFYLHSKKAAIHKKPTPVQIVKVNYPARSAAKIVEAYFKTPSTTDYNGVYRGKYIDFEAKETKRMYLPLSNIHPHQIKHLEEVLTHGGIAFLMIAFTTINEVYLLEAKYVISAYQSIDIKSLKYDDVKEFGHLVNQGYLPRLDYLLVIDRLYFKED